MDASVLLQLVADRPITEFADGVSLIEAGRPDPPLFVLASGSLEVRNRQLALATLDEPGAIVGEIGLLLGTPATADVVAVGAVRVHRIDDAESLFSDHPAFALHLATLLARRLSTVTGFLADLSRQFADQPGTLGLVPTVLRDLLGSSPGELDPGSERDPDSPY